MRPGALKREPLAFHAKHGRIRDPYTSPASLHQVKKNPYTGAQAPLHPRTLTPQGTLTPPDIHVYVHPYIPCTSAQSGATHPPLLPRFNFLWLSRHRQWALCARSTVTPIACISFNRVGIRAGLSYSVPCVQYGRDVAVRQPHDAEWICAAPHTARGSGLTRKATHRVVAPALCAGRQRRCRATNSAARTPALAQQK